MQKNISRVVPPKFYENRKRFIIRWYEDDTNRQKSFRDEQEANEYYELLISHIPRIQVEQVSNEIPKKVNRPYTKSKQSVQLGHSNKLANDIRKLQDSAEYLPKFPPFKDGNSKFFKTVTGMIFEAGRDATNNRDMTALNCIEKFNKIFTSGSNAMLPHKKVEELEDQLDAAIKKIKEMRRIKVKEHAAKHAAGSKANTGVKTAIRSKELLLRSSDSVPDKKRKE